MFQSNQFCCIKFVNQNNVLIIIAENVKNIVDKFRVLRENISFMESTDTKYLTGSVSLKKLEDVVGLSMRQVQNSPQRTK